MDENNINPLSVSSNSITGTDTGEVLKGTDGDDTISGLGGNDTLDGGKGQDVLVGGAGADTYVFGFGYGNDVIAADNVNGNQFDKVLFAKGVTAADLHLSRDEQDNLIIGVGNSDSLTLEGYFKAPDKAVQKFQLADGTTYQINYGNPALNDRISGSSTNDLIAGDSGNDVLMGYAGNDVVDGGVGNDVVDGGAGDDVLRGGDGDDRLIFDAADKVVDGGAGQDVLDATGANAGVNVDMNSGRYSNIEVVTGSRFNDTLAGDKSDNILQGGLGDDTLLGRDGADMLAGGIGNDTLDGGSGDDTLQGGLGSDKYLFANGSGKDTIAADISNKDDTIVFGKGITAGDLNFTQNEQDLIASWNGGQDQVTIENAFGGSDYQISKVQFADGKTYSVQVGDDAKNDGLTGGTASDLLVGLGGNDDLQGGSGDDILQGGSGDDRLDGGLGSDQLVAGQGNDTIIYDAADSLVNGGDGTDILDASAQSGSVTIDLTQSKFSGIEQVIGGKGDDRLTGGAEANTLVGGAGKDILNGGAGNDVLQGGAGSDQYIFNLGSGSDTIKADLSNWEDKVVFGTGIALKDLHFAGDDSGNLVISVGAKDTLTVENFFGGDAYRLFSFQTFDGKMYEFSNGSAGDDVMSGTAANDILSGFSGDDVLLGNSGDDYLDAGAGDDYIDGGAGKDMVDAGDGNDWIVYDSADTYVNGGDGNDTLDASGQTTAVNINLSGPGYAGIEVVKGSSLADTLTGSSADEVLYGNDGNDTLDGGKGNDVLAGGKGTDKYVFNIGSGHDIIKADSSNIDDTVLFGKDIKLSDLQFIPDGDNLNVVVKGSDTLTIEGYFVDQANQVSKFQFSDGSVFSYQQGTANDDNQTGTIANDMLSGQAGNDYIRGGLGNDLIDGGDGDDFLFGEAGNDTLQGGTGNDKLDGGQGQDSIYGGAGNDYITFDSNDIVIDGGDGYDTLVADPSVAQSVSINLTSSKFKSIEEVDGGSLGDFLIGSSNDEVLLGNGGNDTLDGGVGNDTLNGGSGADTYLFGSGYGQDTIQKDAYNNLDTVLFGKGVAVTDLRYTDSGNDLLVNVSAQDILKLQGFNTSGMDSRYQVNSFRFADGQTYLFAKGDSSSTLTGTSANNILKASDVGQTVSGLTGNDILYSGAGNDTLNGGAGQDTYVFTGNFGTDTISADASNYQDTIDLSDYQLDTDNTAFYSDTDNKSAYIDVAAFVNGVSTKVGSIKLDGYFTGSNYKVGKLLFNNPSTNAKQLVNFQIGSLAQDTLNGQNSTDIIFAQDGNDTIYGMAGDDIISGGAGNDKIYGGDGNDNIWDDEGVNIIDGGNGSDELYTSSYDGGTGTLIGGAGNDSYIVGGLSTKGGELVIDNTTAATGDFDRLSFDMNYFNPSSSDFQFTLSGSDLLLNYTGEGGGSIRIKGWTTKPIQAIQFADRALDTNSINNMLKQHTVNIDGTQTLPINGTSQADVYAFKPGYKTAEFAASPANASDLLDLTAINTEMMEFSRTGNNLVIGTGSENYQEGQIILDSYFVNPSQQISTFKAQNPMGSGQLTVHLQVGQDTNDILNGTSQVDYILGGHGDDVIYGGDGNDFITGDWADDTPSTGNDTLYGGAGNDMIWDDHGTNTMYGGDGNDNLVVENTSDNTLYGDNGDDTLEAWGVGHSLYGGAGNDSLYLSGSGTMSGGTGNDKYVVNLWAGDSVVIDNSAVDNNGNVIDNGTDVLSFDPDNNQKSTDFNYMLDETDLLMVSKVQQGAMIRIHDWNLNSNAIESIVFADKTLNKSGIDQLVNSQLASKTVVNITGSESQPIAGTSAEEVFKLPAQSVSEVQFASSAIGSNDLLDFTNCNVERMEFSRQGTDLKMGYGPEVYNSDGSDNYSAPYDGTVVIKDYFASPETSTILSKVTPPGYSAPGIFNVKVGQDGNDFINGTGFSDYILGGHGDDVIHGGDGNDVITGDWGDNTTSGGNDTIYGDGGSDMIWDDWGTNTIYGGDGDDDIIVEKTNNNKLFGDNGNDFIEAWGTGHSLDGGAGNDHLFLGGSGTMTGGAGDDFYEVASTSPADNSQIIIDNSAVGDNGNDRLQIVGYNRPEKSDFSFSMDGNDLLITYVDQAAQASGIFFEPIRIKEWNNNVVESIGFYGGTVNGSDITNQFAQSQGSFNGSLLKSVVDEFSYNSGDYGTSTSTSLDTTLDPMNTLVAGNTLIKG